MESKQKEIRAYKRVMGQKSESSSDYDSESEDENGKKRPPRLDENGNPIVRKKKGIVGELGLDKGLEYMKNIKNIKITDLNPMNIGQKKPKKRRTAEGQELAQKEGGGAQGAGQNNKNELDDSTEDEFESKLFMLSLIVFCRP